MSHVAELASMARNISYQQQAESVRSVEVAALKKNLEMEAQMQMEMIQMLSSIQSHLGSNVNITA